MQIKAECASSTVKEYVLANAVLLYMDAHSREPVYASVHEVKGCKNGISQIAAGTSVSKTGLVKMMKMLVPEDFVQPELLGDHILARGNDHLVWWCKPQKRHVFFKCDEVGKGEVTASVDLPGLVFIVAHGKWHVFAVKSRSRPSASTCLYPAPFLNVWKDGHICVGNVETPKGLMKFNTSAWESSFYGSYFTHTNQHEAGAQTKFKGGIYALWKALLKGEKFSNDWMPRSQETLGNAFERTVLRDA